MATGKGWWDCVCGAMNVASARTCELCGEPKIRSPQARGQGSENLRCAWLTDGRRCLLFADHGPSDRPGLCGWHFAVKGNFRSNEYVVFERWVASLRRYCCLWSHYSPEVLWDWLQGHAREATPARCARGPACRLWEPPTNLRPDELAAARTRLPAVLGRIGQVR